MNHPSLKEQHLFVAPFLWEIVSKDLEGETLAFPLLLPGLRCLRIAGFSGVLSARWCGCSCGADGKGWTCGEFLI